MHNQLVLAELAAEQWGLLTASQAAERGVSNQALAQFQRAGAVERLAHGLYRLTGSPGDELDELRGAWLGLAPKLTATARLRQPEAVVSYRSAAQVHGLGDLDADRHEFTVDGRRTSRRTDIRFHREHLADRDWRPINGLPTTTIAKTIADLASVNTDGGHLAGVVRDAITAKGIDAEVIADVLRPYTQRYGVKLGDGIGLVARFLEEAGIPKATHQASDLVGRSILVESKTEAELLDQLAQRMVPTLVTVREMMAAQVAPGAEELRQSIARELAPMNAALREAIVQKLLAVPSAATNDAAASDEDQTDADQLVTTNDAKTVRTAAEDFS